VTVGLSWLPQTAFMFMLIFARVGTILMATLFGMAGKDFPADG